MEDTIVVKRVMEHYHIFVNGEFYCSCDNDAEVDEELSHLHQS